MSQNPSKATYARTSARQEIRNIAIVFLLLSVLLIGGMSGWQLSNKMLLGPDSAFGLWCLTWWPHNLLAGHNPFYANFFSPVGQNLAWVTAVPTLAILASPITLLGGPILAYNAVTILAISANGILAYLIAREINCNKFSAMASGLLFFFSSYTWSQLLGHLNLYVTAFAIAFVYATVRRCNKRMQRSRYIILASVLLALQFGVSNEIYATLIVFAAMSFAMLFLMWREDKLRRSRVITLGFEVVGGVLLSALWLMPYLYQIFAHHTSGLQNVSSYSADPINYIIPTQAEWMFGARLGAISGKFAGNITEQGIYLGLPIVLLVLIAGAEFYRGWLNRFLLILFIGIAICSLGTHLTILGETTIPMPWLIAAKLPLIKEALPIRFGLYTSLLASLLVGRLLTHSNKGVVKITAGLGIIMLLPNLTMYQMSSVPSESFFKNQTYQELIPVDSNVLILPSYGFWGYQPALWHEEADFSFNIVNGLAGKIPEGFDKYSWYYYGGVQPEASRLGFLSFLKKTGTQFILSDDQAEDPLSNIYRSLQLPYSRYGHVRISKISKDALDRLVLNERGGQVQQLCNSLKQLAKYGIGYEGNENKSKDLTPMAVSDDNFMKIFGHPMPLGSQNVNWTDRGYWLGSIEGDVAIGFSPLDPASADELYEAFKDVAKEVYYPYPSELHGKSKNSNYGQFLVVIKSKGAVSVRCGN